MSLWNSFSYSFKEFHYLFFSVVVIFIFNILLEYNNFLNFKKPKTLPYRQRSINAPIYKI